MQGQGLAGHWAEGMREGHRKHAIDAYDFGRVEAQWLVERKRVLSSRKEGIRSGARCGSAGGRAWSGSASSVQDVHWPD